MMATNARAEALEEARKQIFSKLWAHYREAVPDVPRIEDAIRARGEVWSEDHVAFRTLPGAHCGAHILQGVFEALGYVRRDSLRFDDKKLDAFWLAPPAEQGAPSAAVSPKVFVSELAAGEFSSEVRNVVAKYALRVEASPLPTVRALAARVAAGGADGRAALPSLVETVVCYLTSSPAWGAPLRADWETLLRESEYAAWTLAFGPRANHFTVAVHLMPGFPSLEEFNLHVTGLLGVSMNASGGGVVKGGPGFRLAQSATLAAPVEVSFQEGSMRLPYAFVEFAYRFPLEGRAHDGAWDSYYQGFVVSNADKIFDSTNMRPA
jgi:hypothetical protein